MSISNIEIHNTLTPTYYQKINTVTVQIDLGPLATQISQALRSSHQDTARICPAMDELYSMLGRPAESEEEAEAARLVASIPGKPPSTASCITCCDHSKEHVIASCMACWAWSQQPHPP